MNTPKNQVKFCESEWQKYSLEKEKKRELNKAWEMLVSVETSLCISPSPRQDVQQWL